MKIPASLPITAEQSRAARFQTGLTQANVIEESGLPGHKLKNFETGRFVPDMPFLEALRDYYAQKGIDFAETATSAPLPTTPQARAPGGSMVQPVSRMCFYVSDKIAPETVDQMLERMDLNDERIASLLQSPLKKGFLGNYDESTEDKQRELFGAMAENYLLFRMLQGRNIVSELPPVEDPSTHSHLLSMFFAKSPMAAVSTQPVKAATKQVAEASEQESEGGDE